MAGRIVVFGATGYTGRLVAEALVARGQRPVLAARSQAKLDALADDLGGGLETATADVAEPSSVRALVERGDVLVSTVGPFVRWGAAAADAAVDAGASYIDSTGEPAFIRRVFEDYGPRAERAGIGMLTASGYDWVPGNLAGALALRQAGDAATGVAVGYFLTGGGDMRGAMSGGTAASAAASFLEPGFAFRDGAITTERGGKRARAFHVGGKDLYGISVGGTEHFTLPRVQPRLRNVDVSLGWFGPLSRAMPVVGAGIDLLTALPPVRAGLETLVQRGIKGSTGGPDAAARSRSGSHIVALALDAGGRELAEVHVTGVNGYTFTGQFMAWAAAEAADPGFRATGALGPVDAFGLERLEEGVAEAGLKRSLG
jgi:short subunit dehydrogenase-like uncharacterized protein